MSTDYKEYTEKARRGIKGEAFFESLIVDYAIPHRIARQNDLGVDFICEWICETRTVGLSFAAQVKSTTTAAVTPVHVGKSELNGLEEYRIKKVGDREDVSLPSLNYWDSLGLPVYLFVVVQNGNVLDCYYKRLTPFVDKRTSEEEEQKGALYYKVNNGCDFLAFAASGYLGFARDLIIDYARLAYSKGYVVPLVPEKLGFCPLPNSGDPSKPIVFKEFLEDSWYRRQIEEMHVLTGTLLAKTSNPSEP